MKKGKSSNSTFITGWKSAEKSQAMEKRKIEEKFLNTHTYISKGYIKKEKKKRRKENCSPSAAHRLCNNNQTIYTIFPFFHTDICRGGTKKYISENHLLKGRMLCSLVFNNYYFDH